jgi:cytochrome c
VGPPHCGLFGRRAGSVAGYAYSDALKAKASQKWTQANLDAFLTDPQTFAAGSRMRLKTADPAARAAVIEALKAVK